MFKIIYAVKNTSLSLCHFWPQPTAKDTGKKNKPAFIFCGGKGGGMERI